MTSNLKPSLSDSLARVEAALAPGTLTGKKDELTAIRKAGDTMFFDGAVQWTVTLPDEEKRLNGASESLDNAFADMAACLNFLLQNHDENTPVICAIDTMDAEEMP